MLSKHKLTLKAFCFQQSDATCPVILALEKGRQEDQEFKVSLGYLKACPEEEKKSFKFKNYLWNEMQASLSSHQNGSMSPIPSLI